MILKNSISKLNLNQSDTSNSLSNLDPIPSFCNPSLTDSEPSTCSKRSSSTSHDLFCEQARFKPKLHHQLNMTESDVCDGSKTPFPPINNMKNDFPGVTKQIDNNSNYSDTNNGSTKTLKNLSTNASFKETIEDHSSEALSPLNPNSSFYRNLSNYEFSCKDLKIQIKLIDLQQILKIFKWYFNTPLPSTSEMFPWLHGLHKDNFAQKQFFLYQQCQLKESNIFNPYSLDKPTNIRFLMCIDLSDDYKLDSNHHIFFHNANPKFVSSNNLKNTVKFNEILQKVDVSKLEIKNIIKDMIDDLYNIENEQIIDILTNDCISIKFLPKFLNLDPDRGVSLRNFHIQVSKLSTCSDFIFYNIDDNPKRSSYMRILWLAQQYEAFLDGLPECQYNIFVVKDKITEFNEKLIWNNDFQIKEKIEITRMSAATKLNENIWIGNYWDYQAMIANLVEGHNSYDFNTYKSHTYCDPKYSIITESSIQGNLVDYLPKPKANWKLFMYCHNDATFPNLSLLSNLLFKYTISSHHDDELESIHDYHSLEFPPSGSIGIGDCKKESLMSILNTCKLLYLYSSSNISDPKVLSVLIYCSDGYTELSLFVLCYLMYAYNITLGEAMLKLHVEFGRPFYIFNSDVLILTKLQSLLNKFSPLNKKITNWCELETITNDEINDLLLGPSVSMTDYSTFKLGYIHNEEEVELQVQPEVDELAYGNDNWVKEVEGSIPSQILPYIYLGSLKHANCLPLLNKLGIKSIISVGEQLDWLNGSKFRLYNKIKQIEEDDGKIEIFDIENNSTRYKCSIDTIMKVNNLQDDGIDELAQSLPRVLQFIDDEYIKSNGQTKILIHCRVGVSRSATVVIAEVMRRFNVRIPDAYLYVRVRRLNIIIQPNLRFMYELFKWDELQRSKQQNQLSDLRHIDWFIMCREIMKLNLPYLNN